VTPTAPLPSPAIRWPENGPKRTLDGFWNRNRAAIATMLATTDSGPFPLRLMKWRELERLVVSEIQTLFLIVYGDGPFVQSYLESFAKGIVSDRLSSEAIPVIRLGKIGHAGLYIIGLRTLDTGMRILNRFPFIIEHGGGEKPDCLDMLLKNHVRAAIIIADNADACIEETARRVGTRELQYCSLSVSSATAKYSVATVLRQCAELLSRMGATEASQ
jgi:hypothetical protein